MTTNSSNAIQTEIKVKEQKLGTVTSFIKYLRAVVSDHGPFYINSIKKYE